MKKNKKKGFTLIELVIVIAIIGILAAIAIPRYNKSRLAASEAAHKSNVQMLKTAALVRQHEMGPKEDTIKWANSNEKSNNDDWSKYVEKWPEIPSGLSGHDSYIVEISPNEITVTPDEDDFANSTDSE